MNDSRKTLANMEDAVEQLLGHAEPRPAPPAEDERYVREAVRAEWLATTRRRRTRQRTAGLAIAAAVLLAAAVTFTALQTPAPVPIDVAAIDKSRGSIYRRAQPSAPDDGGASIRAGEILSTGDDAAVGLTWSRGGSLRIDENSRVEFVSATEVRLHRGRVYFDSDDLAPGNGLLIRTPHGSVSHIGTQYMTSSDDEGLTVSVRQGEVRIDGRYYDQIAHDGQQVRFVGSAPPGIVNIAATGIEWQWVETVAPDFAADGRSAYEFLQWVGRETGHMVEFENADVERLALSARLIGTVDGDPRTELRLRMMTIDLDARFDAERSALLVSKSK